MARAAIAALCVVVASVSAQPERPCSAPVEFEAKIFYRDTQREVTEEITGKLVYDALNHRKYISEEKPPVNGHNMNVDIIQLFDQGIQYEIDYGEQECRRTHLRTNFTYNAVGMMPRYMLLSVFTCNLVSVRMQYINIRQPLITELTYNEPDIFCLGPNATWTGDAYIGSSAIEGASLMVETWSQDTKDGNNTIRWTGSYTSKGCIPVRSTTVYAEGHVQSETIMDVVLGVSDPNVFFVDPELCPIPHQ
eukprot:m.126291 g.126291  ORF g.126291 m.126291 type:complete len:249 (+) comp17366_c0_seq6:201-947(+)